LSSRYPSAILAFYGFKMLSILLPLVMKMAREV